MKLLNGRNLKLAFFLSCSASLLLLGGITQSAQTRVQIPERTGYVNDFAGVIDEKTRLQLGTILENVKQKAGIEFALVTIESTSGQDIFDFSRRLATEWNIGSRSSAQKSLLLVLAVNEKTAFTQFSRSVQKDLPEGVLGEMGQRMRTQVTAGHFSEGLDSGIRFFVGSMAQKLALSVDDFEKGPATAEADGANSKTVKPAPVITAPSPSEAPRTKTRSADVREEKVSTTTNRSAEPAPVSDEDESEEVELTLTLPLEARVLELRAFLEARPDSKSKPRALELLVSARAGLGDERLKKGDSTGGVEQLMMAIAEAPVDASEKLFSGVISQIPLNLYLRGERAAAIKAAESIEAKFGIDPKRLLAVSGFYIGTEQGSEATRVAKRAVSLAPDSAEAHQALGLALHISLRLEEAAAEYKRALELDPSFKGARRGLADLTRASGRAEDALALYRQQLVAEPADKAARAGLVLSLLELGRTDEAKTELEAALNADPRNLALLAGAAYWFAAHNELEKALEFGSKAFQIEPRYIWSQVAVARALLGQQKPLEAERIVRFARQHGKFPTLDYELASALAAAGLYDEAAEVLLPAFTVTNGEIETRLGGHALARNASFIDLLAPERRASTFQFAAADTENNAKTLKALLNFASLLDPEKNGGTIDEARAIAAAREFASGNDPARVHRQLYAASRLLQRGIGFQTAYELAEAARNGADAGLNVPALTVVVQADEFREIRARSISAGGTPAIPEAPRNVLSNLLRGRIEDISGWALFNQDKLDEAADHLRRAVNILPEGTPAWRTSLWHLGATLDRLDKEEEALGYYIRSYNSGEPDPIRRTVIEHLYRKVKGSLEGLDEQIRPAAPAVNAPVADRAASTSEPTTAIALPESSPQTLPTETTVSPSTPAADALPTPSPVVEALPTSSPEVKPTPEETARPTPEPTPTPAAEVLTPEAAAPPASEPSPTPTPDPTPTPSPTPARRSLFDPRPDPGDTPAETISKPRATVVTITGRVKDAGNNPIANVVVVLISPQGSVLASTTNEEGIYLFKVAPSTHSYRLIPSKDGFTFEPLDKLLPVVTEDQKEMNFIAVPNKVP